MLSGHIRAFDDYIKSTETVYTENNLDDNLARHDQMAIHCIVTDPKFSTSGPGAIRVQIFHSNDGRHWLPKYSGDGEISEEDNIPASGVANLAGFDEGATPSFRFVRLAITLVAPCTGAHVKILVATRDAGR